MMISPWRSAKWLAWTRQRLPAANGASASITIAARKRPDWAAPSNPVERTSRLIDSATPGAKRSTAPRMSASLVASP